MNNVVHYSLFDTAVNGWLIEQGVLDFVAGKQIGLVVETGCRYFSELAFPETSRPGCAWPGSAPRRCATRSGCSATTSDVAAAEGFFVHVYVDRLTRRPAPLDAALRSALERLLV